MHDIAYLTAQNYSTADKFGILNTIRRIIEISNIVNLSGVKALSTADYNDVENLILKRAVTLLTQNCYQRQEIDAIIIRFKLKGSRLLNALIIREAFAFITQGVYTIDLFHEILTLTGDNFFNGITDVTALEREFTQDLMGLETEYDKNQMLPEREADKLFKAQIFAIQDKCQMEQLIMYVGVINMAFALGGSFEYDSVREHVFKHILRNATKYALQDILNSTVPYNNKDFINARRFVLNSKFFIMHVDSERDDFDAEINDSLKTEREKYSFIINKINHHFVEMHFISGHGCLNHTGDNGYMVKHQNAYKIISRLAFDLSLFVTPETREAIMDNLQEAAAFVGCPTEYLNKQIIKFKMRG